MHNYWMHSFRFFDELRLDFNLIITKIVPLRQVFAKGVTFNLY